MKQFKLFQNETGSDTRHGSDFRTGKRKIARPIVTKSPMHLVLRSSRARGKWSLQRKQREVQATTHRLAKRYHVRIYSLANVGNHLHLGVQAKSRHDFQSFLRVLPQALMFLVTGALKGKPAGKFWDKPLFSRVVAWGRDWSWLQNYLEKNRLEGHGQDRDRLDYTFKTLWESG